MEKRFDKAVILLIVLFLLALFLVAAFWVTFDDARGHDLNKTELIVLSNSVMHDNNMLIRLIRNYVINLEDSYRDEYIELLNDSGSFKNRIDRMLEIGLSDTGREKVRQIEETWELLETMESNVLSYIDNNEYEKAVDIVFGEEYRQADYLLTETFIELIADIEERSAETTHSLNVRLVIVMAVFSVTFLGITLGLLMIFKNNRELRDSYKKQKDAFEYEAKSLQRIFDSLPIAVRIVDAADLTIVYANQAVMKVYGYDSIDDVLGRKVAEFVSPEQPDGRKIADIFKEVSSREAMSIDIQCVKKDGQLFMARIASCKINFNGRPSSLATIEDITLQQEYTQKLENIAQQEYEANQLKSRFLATMSHEVRTPMNAILGIAEIMMKDETLSEETEDALRRIYDAGSLLLNIINDILDLSKIEAGKLELVPIKYDIPSLINDTVQLTRLRFESSPIDFILEVDADTPVNLFGDELRIRQILNNILSNAFKYTKAGKVTFSVSAGTQEHTSKDEVIIIFTVADTGQGMSPEQLCSLFDEYTRFNIDAANRTTVGTGLGMSITKRLVELMHGDISVESEVDKGSTFTVRLPQKRIDGLVCGSEMSKTLREHNYKSTRILQKSGVLSEYMPYGRVLVVDDMETNIYVARGMLMPYGLNVDTAKSGFEAIRKVEDGLTYDIIFMDHMMPKMDGMQTVKKLRAMGYEGCIVALTANALVGQAEVFLKNGFDGYVSKPVDSRELNAVLNEHIRDKKQ